MSGTAVAIGASVASAASGIMGMVGSGSQSDAAGSAGAAAIAQQQEAMRQETALNQPYMDLGKAAINPYENLLGIGPQGSAGALAALKQTPGYQFTQREGNQATAAQANAMGLGMSGNTLKALDKYNTGLATQTYQQQLQNLLAPVSIGQSSATNVANVIGETASNTGAIGMNTAANQANIQNAGTAALMKGFGGAANTLAGLGAPAGTVPLNGIPDMAGGANTGAFWSKQLPGSGF